MELSIIRRETTGAVPNQYNESETITKFEIMDGAPVRGGFSTIPPFPSEQSPCSPFTALWAPPNLSRFPTQCVFSIGETIPIRLFLGGFDLTPTFRDVNKKFSVRYYLNLVLIDEENRRYFKQQEITVYRVPEVRISRSVFYASPHHHSQLSELSTRDIFVDMYTCPYCDKPPCRLEAWTTLAYSHPKC